MTDEGTDSVTVFRGEMNDASCGIGTAGVRSSFAQWLKSPELTIPSSTEASAPSTAPDGQHSRKQILEDEPGDQTTSTCTEAPTVWRCCRRRGKQRLGIMHRRARLRRGTLHGPIVHPHGQEGHPPVSSLPRMDLPPSSRSVTIPPYP